MDHKKLLKLIKNSDRLTLKKDFEILEKSKGFAVSLSDFRIRNLTEKSLQDALKKIDDLAGTLSIDRYCIGMRKQGPETCIDLTVIINPPGIAKYVGKVFGQKSIYNFATESVISL